MSRTAGPERSSRSPRDAASEQVTTRARIIPRILVKRTEFSYHLPPERIAQEPRKRGQSRMMVVTPTEDEPLIEHDRFVNFPSRLEPDDVVVINDTRVIPARLFAQPKGAMKRPIEILLIRQLDATTWEAWAKPAKRLRAGDALHFSDRLTGYIVERSEGTGIIRFDVDLEEIER